MKRRNWLEDVLKVDADKDTVGGDDTADAPCVTPPQRCATRQSAR
jgi:hypothetical protein